jgi:hypothetical protein
MHLRSLSEPRTKQIQGVGGCLLVVLSVNLFRTGREYYPLYVRLLNGLILGILINSSLFFSLLRNANKWRYFLVLPLVISSLGAAFVVAHYHVFLVPVTLAFYFWVGQELFRRNTL